MYKNGNVTIFKLESDAIQIEVNERESPDFKGFILDFAGDASGCELAYRRIVTAGNPLAYASKIFENQNQ